jgi:hypothetical protein
MHVAPYDFWCLLCLAVDRCCKTTLEVFHAPYPQDQDQHLSTICPLTPAQDCLVPDLLKPFDSIIFSDAYIRPLYVLYIVFHDSRQKMSHSESMTSYGLYAERSRRSRSRTLARIRPSDACKSSILGRGYTLNDSCMPSDHQLYKNSCTFTGQERGSVSPEAQQGPWIGGDLFQLSPEMELDPCDCL